MTWQRQVSHLLFSTTISKPALGETTRDPRGIELCMCTNKNKTRENCAQADIFYPSNLSSEGRRPDSMTESLWHSWTQI